VGRRGLLLIPLLAFALALALVAVIHRVDTYDPGADAEDVPLRMPVSASGTGSIECEVVGSGDDTIGDRTVHYLALAGDQGASADVYIDGATQWTETTTTARALRGEPPARAIERAGSRVLIRYQRRGSRFWALDVRELSSGWHRAKN